MTACLPGRQVRIRLRNKSRRALAKDVTVVCPAGWSRARLLRYVREEHPYETVVITEWPPFTLPGSWEPKLWLVHPAEILKDTLK